MTGPRVMIVDDHPIWLHAVERDLADAGFEVVAAVKDGEAAVRIAPAVCPDVVLMDLHLPGMSGAAATSGLVKLDPSVRVLMLSASGEGADVLDAVKAGARGYVLKSSSSSQLINAVHATAAGEAVFGPGLAALVLGEARRIDRDEPSTAASLLTDRETEVLRMVATGLSAKRIAEELGVSHRTVQNHVQNTLQKLQLHNRVELTRWAIQAGLAE